MRPIFGAALAAALAAGLALAAPPAFADDPTLSNGQAFRLPDGDDARRPLRYEIDASGTLTIEPDGRVSEVDLEMKPAVREAYRRAIKGWTFDPVEVDGRVVRAKAHFRLVGFGLPIDGSREVQLGVEHVWFLDPPQVREAASSPLQPLRPPTYPSNAAQAAFGATVELLLKIAQDGSVADAGVASLSLDAWQIESRRRAEDFAESFAERALRAARDWSFAGHPDATPGGTVIVPVTFHPPQRPLDGWRPQIPVDVTLLPWMVAAQQEAVAMTASGAASSSRFKLVDDVAGTTIN